MDAWDLWCNVQTQWRAAFGGFTGLDYPAVYHVAETMGIPLDDLNLQRIQGLEMHAIEKMTPKDEGKNGS